MSEKNEFIAKLSIKNKNRFDKILSKYQKIDNTEENDSKLSSKGKQSISKINKLSSLFVKYLEKKKLVKKDEIKSLESEINDLLKTDNTTVIKLFNSPALSVLTSLATPSILGALKEFVDSNIKKKK